MPSLSLRQGEPPSLLLCEKIQNLSVRAADNLTALFLRVIDGKGVRPLEEFDMPFGYWFEFARRVQVAGSKRKWLKIAEETQDFRLLRPKAMAFPTIAHWILGGDFRRHATSYLINRLFGIHDRNTFEVLHIQLGQMIKAIFVGPLRMGATTFRRTTL